MKLSVIIPCLNAVDTIAAQLDALSAQNWSEPWEVIIADNGSTDGTQSVLELYKDRLPNFKVVDAADRRGRGHARNVGAAAANGKYLAFCDADDEIEKDWVKNIGTAVEKHQFVASRFDTEKLQVTWLQRYQKIGQSDGLQTLWYPPHFLHAGGCGLAIKKSIHETVDGFNESIRLEDTDYCIRVQLTGVKLHFAGNALIHVRHRENAKTLFRQLRLRAMHNVRMYKTYRPENEEAPWKSMWFRYFKNWLYLLRMLPSINDKSRRAEIIFLLARQLGRLQGSIKYRVPPV